MTSSSSKSSHEWLVDLPPLPEVEFGQFGPIESNPISRQQRLVGAFLSRNWLRIPHVTHHDEVDIDALEQLQKVTSVESGRKLTLAPFLVKAVVKALQKFPQFNASISSDGASLIMKRYFHIGVAVDVPDGLLVPVIRDCDRKSIVEIADELTDKSQRARTKGLPLAEMSGGCFSISSLGAIGGTAFTPIINAPEVAILGITRSAERLYLVDGVVTQKRVLPLSLSYDHRVINGADAARFCRYLAEQLQTPEQLLSQA